MKNQSSKILPSALTLFALVLSLTLIQVASAAAWTTSGPLNAGRSGHTATLLPNGRVLVAGGGNNSGLLAGAELYDPAFGTWTATGALSTTRVFHTATLLPNGKVLVVGGNNDGVSLSSAEMFDPATGTWTTVGQLNIPRWHHTATLLTNGKVLVEGGQSGSSLTDSAELFDPANETWTATGTMHTKRYGHTATLLPNGDVLVAGGWNGNPGALSNAERFDPASGMWTVTGPLNTTRSEHTAILLPNGMVLVAGGGGSSGVTNSSELYDPASGTWKATDSLKQARYFHTATLLPNGKVLVTGGISTSLTALSNTELYDPVGGTWTAAVDMSSTRDSHTATLLPNGRVLVTGGSGTSGVLSSTEVYDYAVGMWTNTGTMNMAHEVHTATLLPNGKALIVGGFGSGRFLAGAELFDPATRTWNATDSLNQARHGHTAILLPNGKVLVAGGLTSSQPDPSSVLASAELFNSLTGTWMATGTLNDARRFHAATLLTNGKVVVTGGVTLSTSLSSAELYDSATGTWTMIAAMPGARYAHTATLLSNGQVLVVGGIGNSGVLSSAALYAPSTGVWTRVGSLRNARFSHTATLLSNGKVLIAGGRDYDTYFATTELFDPNSGTWTTTGSMTRIRAYHTATLLPSGEVLVAGGYDNNSYLSGVELYQSAIGNWMSTGALNLGRDAHTATLLADGKVLVAGGDIGGLPLSRAELYDVGLAFSNSWQPQITTFNSPLSLGSGLLLSGSRFRGVSEGSSGNSQDSPSDYPLVQLRSVESGQTLFLPATNWSTNSFTSTPVIGFPVGYALVTAFVNGIPSDSIITAVVKGLATVTLGNLSQKFDATAKVVSVTTSPPGLTVNLTYNGSTNAPTNVGSYTVIGTVNDPNYEGSATNTLVISQATLSILIQPASQTVTEGETVTFTVTAEGTPQLLYQWRHGVVNIGGATNFSLMLSNVQYGDAGDYSVVVNNGFDSAASSNATLTVNRIPAATPGSITVDEDTSAPITLSGSDPDGDPLMYVVLTQLSHGTLTGTAPDLFYQPLPNYFGGDSFTFKVNDGQVDSAEATISITVNPVNDPPVADASATVTLLVSPNDTNATVVLDGSRSFDVDGDELQYLWSLPGSTNPLASGVVAVVVLPVGTNFISLVVGDGSTTATNTITVEIITTAQVVERLVSAVESDVSRSQALIATLNAAIASIDRSNPTAAIHQLQAFQNEVRAQVSTLDPALAQTFIQTAQEVIDTLSNGATDSSPGAAARFHGVTRMANGKVHVRFSAALGRIHLVAASTNMTDWELIGVAVGRGDGMYEFEDSGAARFQTRFYRIISP